MKYTGTGLFNGASFIENISVWVSVCSRFKHGTICSSPRVYTTADRWRCIQIDWISIMAAQILWDLRKCLQTSVCVHLKNSQQRCNDKLQVVRRVQIKTQTSTSLSKTLGQIQSWCQSETSCASPQINMVPKTGHKQSDLFLKSENVLMHVYRSMCTNLWYQ